MNLNQILDALWGRLPQEGAGAQASIAVLGWQEARLSSATPPLHEVPVLHPYIQAGSKVTAELKLTPPPGHNCALEGGASSMQKRDMSTALFIWVRILAIRRNAKCNTGILYGCII